MCAVKWEEGDGGEMCVKLSGRKGRGRDVCAVKWEEGEGDRCVCS